VGAVSDRHGKIKFQQTPGYQKLPIKAKHSNRTLEHSMTQTFKIVGSQRLSTPRLPVMMPSAQLWTVSLSGMSALDH
jgi:hypothetical protein